MENPNADHTGCHSHGNIAGCDNCNVYNEGGCPIADELYDDMKSCGGEELKLYLDLYEDLLDFKICNHKEGMTPIGGWIICRKCGDNLRKMGQSAHY